jgi:hypothetical protein
LNAEDAEAGRGTPLGVGPALVAGPLLEREYENDYDNEYEQEHGKKMDS